MKKPTGSTSSGFEIPLELRDVAEKSVDQAKRAFDGFIDAAHNAVSTMEGQAAAAQTGVKEMSAKAMGFAEQNMAASFDFAQKLVRAKDVQEVLALQTAFVQSQMASLAEQAKDLGQTVTKATRPPSKGR